VAIVLAVGLAALSGCTSREGLMERYDGFPGVSGVDGAAVGVVADRGEFYEFAQKIMKEAERSELRGLLRERDPIARAMGIVCLARHLPETEPDIRGLYNDREVVEVRPLGCMVTTMTVGEFAREIVTSREFRYSFIAPENRVEVRFYRMELTRGEGWRLVEFIKHAIAPGTWYEIDNGAMDLAEDTKPVKPKKRAKSDVGHPCTIVYVHGKLVVCHTPEVQAKVRALIDSIRE